MNKTLWCVTTFVTFVSIMPVFGIEQPFLYQNNKDLKQTRKNYNVLVQGLEDYKKESIEFMKFMLKKEFGEQMSKSLAIIFCEMSLMHAKKDLIFDPKETLNNLQEELKNYVYSYSCDLTKQFIKNNIDSFLEFKIATLSNLKESFYSMQLSFNNMKQFVPSTQKSIDLEDYKKEIIKFIKLWLEKSLDKQMSKSYAIIFCELSLMHIFLNQNSLSKEPDTNLKELQRRFWNGVYNFYSSTKLSLENKKSDPVLECSFTR
ncbi:hypothetical protein KAU11_02695 [Candidatus Babeliales bacterium]|nr:hypothetical protein [Candidatus Babeliales bacterium]